MFCFVFVLGFPYLFSTGFLVILFFLIWDGFWFEKSSHNLVIRVAARFLFFVLFVLHCFCLFLVLVHPGGIEPHALHPPI
jgi:hypothetical protein